MAGLVLFGLTLPISKSAGNVLLLLIYSAVIVGMARDKEIREMIFTNIRQPLTFALLLYFAVSFVGVFYTQRYSDGFQTANKFLSLLAIYIMVSVLVQSVQDEEKRYKQVEKMLFAFLIGLVILNVIGIMTYFGVIGHKKFELPLSPMHVHHIWFSNINALGLYVAVSFLLFSPRGKQTRERVFLYSFLFLALICILLSLARTAWFGILLTSLVMTFLCIRKKKIAFVLIATVVAAGIAAYQFLPIVHERIGMIDSDITRYSSGETMASVATTSLGGRFLMWKAAFMMFLSNPLFGVGTGDYVPVMTSYVESGQMPKYLLGFNQPHNIYLFALATNGLFGLAALLYVFYRGLRFSLPLVRTEGTNRFLSFVAAATIIHFMIAGMTDSFFNIQILRYAFAFVMGVTVREINAVRS